MTPRRSYRAEEVTIEVLEHYRQFAANIVMSLGEEFAGVFIMLDDEIERRKAKGSAMDRIRQFTRTAA